MRVRELRLTYHTVPGVTLPANSLRIRTPVRCAELARSLIGAEGTEVFLVLLVDARHKLVATHVVSRGTLESTMVHPREVFKAAILANAGGIVCVHNHPSGDVTPSLDDLEVITRLNQVADLVGIPIHDHLIVSEGDRWWSWFDSDGRPQMTRDTKNGDDRGYRPVVVGYHS